MHWDVYLYDFICIYDLIMYAARKWGGNLTVLSYVTVTSLM